MNYKIIFDKSADKQLKKIDKTQQRNIVNWIIKNLENTNDPRVFGKTLKGNLKITGGTGSEIIELLLKLMMLKLKY